jgi:hypothetical protein
VGYTVSIAGGWVPIAESVTSQQCIEIALFTFTHQVISETVQPPEAAAVARKARQKESFIS